VITMTIRTRTTPTIDIPEIEQAVDDHELLALAFQDAVEALARYAMVGRTVFHSCLLLDEIREQFERGNRP